MNNYYGECLTLSDVTEAERPHSMQTSSGGHLQNSGFFLPKANHFFLERLYPPKEFLKMCYFQSACEHTGGQTNRKTNTHF